MVRSLLHHVPEIQGVILEACAGHLAIASELRRHARMERVFTNDIDKALDVDFHFDASRDGVWQSAWEWAITNPPWAMPRNAPPLPVLMVQHAVDALLSDPTRIGAAFLLRVTFLEATENRGHWLQENPPAKIIVQPRYSFTGDGKSDSATCAWMIWSAVPLIGPPIVVETCRAKQAAGHCN
jgi:hypothetical protein